MIDPSKVDYIRMLHSKGYSIRRISKAVEVSRKTIRRYIGMSESCILKQRTCKLAVLDKDQVIDSYKRFGGNASLVYRHMQEDPEFYGLKEGCNFTLRSLQKYINKHYLYEQTVFGTPEILEFHCEPGQQLQIDFTKDVFKFADGERQICIFEAVYSWSHKIDCYIFEDMSQRSWLMGITKTVLKYGVPLTILCDNDKSLIKSNDGVHYVVNPTFKFFCETLGISPRACKPYSPKTKGRVERAGGYIKGNALKYIQGLPSNEINSIEELQDQLEDWKVNVADQRTFPDERLTKPKFGPAKVSVATLYEYEKDFLTFPKLEEDDLQLQIERCVVNARGVLKFFGTSIQIQDKKHWKKTVNVAVFTGGNFLVTSEGGASICEGRIDKENLKKFPFTEAKKRSKNNVHKRATASVATAKSAATARSKSALEPENGQSLPDLSTATYNTQNELSALFDEEV